MVINLGNNKHHNKTSCRDHCLSSEQIHSITIVRRLRIVGTGTVQHNQTETDNKNQNRKQVIVKIFNFLSRPFPQDFPTYCHLLLLFCTFSTCCSSPDALVSHLQKSVHTKAGKYRPSISFCCCQIYRHDALPKVFSDKQYQRTAPLPSSQTSL